MEFLSSFSTVDKTKQKGEQIKGVDLLIFLVANRDLVILCWFQTEFTVSITSHLKTNIGQERLYRLYQGVGLNLVERRKFIIFIIVAFDHF